MSWSGVVPVIDIVRCCDGACCLTPRSFCPAGLSDCHAVGCDDGDMYDLFHRLFVEGPGMNPGKLSEWACV